MRRYQWELDQIRRVFEDEGIALPDDLLTSSVINDRLEDILDSVGDDGYLRGVDSVHECCNPDCYY